MRAAKAGPPKTGLGQVMAAKARTGKTRAGKTRTGKAAAGKILAGGAGAATPEAPGGDVENAALLDSARLAEEIGIAALDLAQRANAAGLTTLGFLLEGVALEAGTEAVTRRWPTDAATG